MRLIDADLFKQQMSAMALTSPSFFTGKVVKLLEIIDKQPTAFDLEAVMEQIEDYIHASENTNCPNTNLISCEDFPCCELCRNEWLRMIVRSGGVK